MRIVQLTDTHLFADPNTRALGVETHSSLRAVLEAVARLRPAPEALLLTGDLGHDEEPASYQRLSELLAPLALPAYWLPGNHDAPAVMIDHLAGQPPGAYDLGTWRLVTLTTHVPGLDSGRLSEAELDRLAEEIRTTITTHRPMIVALHHPPVPVDSDWLDRLSLDNSSDFFDVIDQYGSPRLVVAGHVHQEQTIQRGDVTVLTSPSTCAQFAPDSPEFRQDELPGGFRVLDLADDGSFSSRVVRVAGSGLIDAERRQWMREQEQ